MTGSPTGTDASHTQGPKDDGGQGSIRDGPPSMVGQEQIQREGDGSRPTSPDAGNTTSGIQRMLCMWPEQYQRPLLPAHSQLVHHNTQSTSAREQQAGRLHPEDETAGDTIDAAISSANPTGRGVHDLPTGDSDARH